MAALTSLCGRSRPRGAGVGPPRGQCRKWYYLRPVKDKQCTAFGPRSDLELGSWWVDTPHGWAKHSCKKFDFTGRCASVTSCSPPARCWREMAHAYCHPSQGHGSSPAAFHQKPRCVAGCCAPIVPGQSSFSPRFDAELPAVPAPQRVILHPHQLHISTRQELLAYPWWSCVSARTVETQNSSQKPRDSS